MFETDLKILNNELESTVNKYGYLQNELARNRAFLDRIINLRFCRDEYSDDKSLFIKTILISASTVFGVNLLVLLALPEAVLVTLAFSSITALVPSSYTLLSYLQSRLNFKRCATDEDLELEEKFDKIQKEVFRLTDKCEDLEKIISDYSELIGYLNDYNQMMKELDVFKKGKIDELNNMFSEYLDEKVDYTKVHLNGPFEVEKVQIKKLTNK